MVKSDYTSIYGYNVERTADCLHHLHVMREWAPRSDVMSVVLVNCGWQFCRLVINKNKTKQ